MHRRRAMLIAAAWPALAADASRAQAPPVVAPRRLDFPRDFGAHPAYRTEWWYATGELRTQAGAVFGFQSTFFRSRTGLGANDASRFAPRQLLFAHAAVTDLGARRLLHAQRIARWNGDASAGLAAAAEDDTRVHIGAWRFERGGGADAGRYRALLSDRQGGFGFDLQMATTQPLLLQGDAGFSRKGPDPAQASHYYSQPHLAVRGTLWRDSGRQDVEGVAWLDHEWSETVMPADAVGWDWIGMNLDGGGALTAFRLRRADGSASWAGGSHRPAGGPTVVFGAADVRFTPGRRWSSPATAASYPVEWQIDTPAGTWRVRARLDAQELDSRASTGTAYWEGLSELLDAQGRPVGRGYLEMTGYAGRLRL
jgi:predicted secreted hydrolase